MAQTPQREDCDIFEDSEGRDTKHKIVRSMRGETLLNSMSKVATFIGGPLFAAGLGMAAPTVFAHGLAGAAAAIGTLGVVAPVAVGILAAGALFVAAAVAADFVSSRIYQDKMLDMQEFNAKRAGHHIVHELKAQNMCLTAGQSEVSSQKQWAANMAPRGQQENWGASVDAQRQQAELAVANGSSRA